MLAAAAAQAKAAKKHASTSQKLSEKIDTWFDKYKDHSSSSSDADGGISEGGDDSMSEEGMQKFCSDVGLDPEDPVVIALAQVNTVYLCSSALLHHLSVL